MVSSNKSINVSKRNSRESEVLNIDKIHSMVEYACEDISGVSSSQVEMNADLQFYDNISTDEIQKIFNVELDIYGFEPFDINCALSNITIVFSNLDKIFDDILFLIL